MDATEKITAIDGLKIIINDVQSVLDLLFSFISDNMYNGLIIAIIGGEVTLITLFFALIPMLLDKRKNEYYLGTKVNDFFLFYSNERGELLKTWTIGMGILIVNILLCFIDWIRFAYICAGIFFAFITHKICVYLNFISRENDIREEIKNTAEAALKKESIKTIEKMVKTSNDDWKIIYENMRFLSEQKEGHVLLGDYVNRLFDEKSEHKQKIIFEIEELISKNKYCYDVCLDTHEVYKFFRNSLDDYNKEDYYNLMFTLILNDYNLCIKNSERRGNYAILIMQAVESSIMIETNKRMVIDRIIRNIEFLVQEEDDIRVGEECYYNKYKYIFSFIKHLIDQGDIQSFEQFIKHNRYIDDENTFIVDIYITCMAYLYYLIEIETTYYVKKEEKSILNQMKDVLSKAIDFNHIVTMTYLYEKYVSVIDNLRNVSTWWDRMNLDDVKTCVVPQMIETVVKCLFMIFGKEHIYGKYEYSSISVDMFKYDIKKGQLSDRHKFSGFFKFVGYKFEDDDYESFENQFARYIVEEYKEQALLTEIDKNQLKEKIKKEEFTLAEKLPELNIFNKKKSNSTKTIAFGKRIGKSVLDTYFKNRSIIRLDEIERWIEQEIYQSIIKTITDIRYIGFEEWRDLPNVLNGIKNSYYYLRPQNDMLGKIPGLTDPYENVVSKFNIIDTTVTDIRLLVEDYRCSFKSISMELKELTDLEIESVKKKYAEGEEVYYKEDEMGVEIPYNSKEIEELIKNTNINIIINIEFGLDVIGEHNIAFIRE